MKRDLQLNYGELENIIEQLHTYKGSLERMHTSLDDIKSFVQQNQGKSIDAWMTKMGDSKVKMEDYKTQVNDLLNLFENYVSDTTSYISPVSRRVMMRVDRNDIWMNLKQVESGMDGNVGKALRQTYQSPTSILSMFSDVTEAEREASRHNQGQMDYIQQQVKQTHGRLEYKMDELWDIYHSKVVKFENVDDAYNDKAGAVKDKYTNLFESFWDGVEDIAQGVSDLVSGVNNTLEALLMGVLSVAADIGIVVSSGTIPNPIEPDWLQKKADSTVDGYTQSLQQLVKDPMNVVESLGQSFSDAVDEKGIAYMTGAALPSLVPATWALKGVRGVSALGKMSDASKLKSVIPHSKDYLQKKVDLVKTEMKSSLKCFGDRKLVPAPYARQLSTGYSNMPVMGMDWKTLNEVKTNLFAVKGEGKVSVTDGKIDTQGASKNRYKDYTRGFDVEPEYSSYKQRVKTTPVNKGEWSNERAESLFISDKTGEIKKYLDGTGVDGVEYKNGMPDFTPFSKGEIKLENMTNDRKSNFSTADEELAKKWSTSEQKWTAEDIADWREDNKYTWHELNDLETIQLVPSKINSVFKHLGGVGEYNIKVELGE